MTDDHRDLADALAVALRPVLGHVDVDPPARLTGGASRATWAFEAVDQHGVRHELIARLDPPGRPSPPGAMGREASAMQAAWDEGVKVPEVLVVIDDPELFGGAGMIMRRVHGEALARRILRDDRFELARTRLVTEAAAALAGIHRVRPEVVGGSADDPVATLRSLLDGFSEPVPTFELALRWLDERRPAPTGTSLVHGDFRLGNLMVDDGGLSAVLDWELVHAGDPAEDLGWLCVRAWRFGQAAPVAGLGDRAELLAAYAAAGGADIDPEVLRWWEVYGTLRWGVICLAQTSVHLHGAMRSVELAAIGRRVAETEWDLMLLIDPDAARLALGVPQPEPEPPRPGLHGRPTASELVEAVREQLVQDAEAGGGGAYRARVAANALRIVERELRCGADQQERRDAALGAAGFGDEADLTAALRRGVGVDVIDLVASGVVDRVRVANPAYLTD